MVNIAKVLKAEIARISRKEAKAAVGPIGQSHTTVKKMLVGLKKRVAFLEKENRRLLATMKKRREQYPETAPEQAPKTRFTSKGIHSLRSRLHLTQSEFGKLLGTTAHSVYLWEKKDGSLKLRNKTKDALSSIRGFKAKDAKATLAEMGSQRRRSKTARRKKRKA